VSSAAENGGGEWPFQQILILGWAKIHALRHPTFLHCDTPPAHRTPVVHGPAFVYRASRRASLGARSTLFFHPSTMSSDSDPRVASKRVEFPAKAKKEETDPMGDGYLSMSTVASSVGLFMRVRRERVYGRGAPLAHPDPDPPFSPPPPHIPSSQQRYFCYAGVGLCLMSLANRRVDTFSWSSFVTGLV
jgi:hypothetical protein